MVEILAVGIAIGFNFIILRYKYKKKRYNDLALDITVLVVLGYLFGGTILGMAAAMVGGMLVSLYLLFDDGLKSGPTEHTYKPKKDLNLKW